jgi:hypothetical protein
MSGQLADSAGNLRCYVQIQNNTKTSYAGKALTRICRDYAARGKSMNVGKVKLSQRRPLQWFWFVSMLLLTLNARDSGAMFDSTDSLNASAQRALEEKNYSDSAAAANSLIRKQPDGYQGYFLLAQAETQLGDRNASLSALEHAIKHGLKDATQIEKNALLEPLRQMPAYASMMAENFPNRGGPDSDGVSIRQNGNSQEIRAVDVLIKLNQN